MVVVFLLVAGRLVQLQGISSSELAARGLGQRVHTVALAAERGSIFDRNGNELAVSVPRTTIYADPRVIDDPAGYAAQLAPILGRDEATLADAIDADEGVAFVYLSRQVEANVADAVRALALPGIGMYDESTRRYPNGDLAAPIIGFVGTDGNGLGGIEYAYEDQLVGDGGSVTVERDPQGREIPESERDYVAPSRGDDLVLTIDQNLQYETERMLTEGVNAAGAKGGVALVIDVLTGDVLSMATVNGPRRAEASGAAKSNDRVRAVTDVYEPGSTSKVITIAGALEDGKIGPDTPFQVPYSLAVEDAVFEDHDAHAVQTWNTRDILRESSNVGTIMIGRTLGEARLDHYLRAFGFGKLTSLDLPGEAPGLLLDVDDWSGTTIATVSIGNGLAVTATQMANVYATIANGGTSVPPRLIAATIDENGKRHDRATTKGTRVVSESTARVVSSMLADVVADGTGKAAAIPGYEVAGKTGTARKPPYDKCPQQCTYIASFAGFAPANNPRFASIVVIDEPSTLYYGGLVAAPVFARVMQYALRSARVAPTADTSGSLAPLPTAPLVTTTPVTTVPGSGPANVSAGE